MGDLSRLRIAVTVVAASVIAAIGFAMSRNGASAAPAGLALTPQTFEALKTRILPTVAEMAWQQIAWRDGFFDGVVEAQAADKPIFLWIYEGHPRGTC